MLGNITYFCGVYFFVRFLSNIMIPLLAAGWLAGCKKDHSVLGVDVQPGVDGLQTEYSESSQVYAHTARYDSVISTNTGIKFLGSNTDPYFGRLDVGLYLNSSMNLTDLNFGASAYLTSAEIVLAIDDQDIVGSSTANLTYYVHALDSSLSPSRAYYTSKKNLHSTAQALTIGTYNYSTMGGKTVLRIPVSPAYASTILKNPQYLVNNETFQARYKGFYIRTAVGANSEGIIYKCNLDDALSGFYLYYKAGVSPSDTVQSFKFSFTGSTASRFNTVTYDPAMASASLKAQLAGDSTAGNGGLFLKGMGVTRLKVQIPDLNKYAATHTVSVNRAELIFHVDPSFTPGAGKYTLPSKLALIASDSLGRETPVLDQLNSTDLFRYDGTYDASNNRYVFNIARHVQAILKGQRRNYGFYLCVTDPTYPYALFRDANMERVILAGDEHPVLKPKFSLSFIRFKND